MSKLTIENYTDWNTQDIRAAVRAAEEHFGLTWNRRVIVKYARSGGMRGRGAYPVDRRTLGRLEGGYTGHAEGQLVKLYLPVEPPTFTDQLVRDFLWLVLHEVGHNAGLSHRDMGVASALNKVWGLAEKPKQMQELSLRWDRITDPEVLASQRAIAHSKLLIKRSNDALAKMAMWEEKLKLAERRVKMAKKKLAKARLRVVYYQKKAPTSPEVPANTDMALAAKEPA